MQFSTVIYIQNKESDKLRKEISKKFHSIQSLKQWALHITIGSGVLLSEENLKKVTVELRKMASLFNPFRIKLRGFGYKIKKNVDNCEPYVVYVNVEMNDKLKELNHLVEEVLEKYERWYEIEEYDPHMTLAYEDLTKENFIKLKKWLEESKKEVNFDFSINSFSFALHKGRNDRREEYTTFFLGK